MHYFKKNIGDYAKKAGRLTMLQHGAYTLLIDTCYDKEQFPTRDEAIEWTWSSTQEEINAVEFVLKKFFVLENGLYVDKEIQKQIDDYKLKAEENQRIAYEREAKRKRSVTTGEQNSTNRARTVHEPSPSVNEPPPNQEPVNHKPVNQEPIKSKAETAPASRLPADWVPSASDIEFCKTERPDLQASTVADRFRDYWCAIAGQKGRKADWPATWRNWVRNERVQAKPLTAEPAFRQQSRHAGFSQLDYSEGVTADGRIA